MNTPRIFVAAAWLASLAAAYFSGSSGESARHSTAAPPAPTPVPTVSADAVPAAAPGDEASREEVRSEQPSVALLIARARLEMAGGNPGMRNSRGMLRAMAALAELDDAQIQEALAEVEQSVREAGQKQMLYSALLGLWAETDGRAAMAYAQGKLGKSSLFENGAVQTVIDAWALRDPEAVWKWFEAQPKDDLDDHTRGMAASSVFRGMAAHDLESALARLGTVANQSPVSALIGIVESASDDASRRRLLDRTASLPPDLRDQIRTRVTQEWALSAPEEVVAWTRSLPADEQKAVRSSAGQALLQVNPALAAEFMLEGADEKDKRQILNQIVSGWTQKNVLAAGEWIAKQPQDPELDAARYQYAAVVVHRDPTAAMDWARSVQNEKQRADTIEMVYGNWRAKDPTAATAALRATGLPPATINQLVQKPPQPPGNGTLMLSVPATGGKPAGLIEVDLGTELGGATLIFSGQGSSGGGPTLNISK